MKIAIIGMGPSGLEAAFHFENLGAEVRLFQSTRSIGGLELIQDFPLSRCWSEITSFAGRNLLTQQGQKQFSDNEFLGKIPTGKEYSEQYLRPLRDHVATADKVKRNRVLRVHKRFLGASEEPINGKRILDLFRVVYQVEPNQSAADELPEGLRDSLSESYEAFEDFDVVIDATGTWNSHQKLGPAGVEAVGEARAVRKGKIVYGLDCWRALNEKQLEGDLAIVSDHYQGLSFLLATLKADLPKVNSVSFISPWQDKLKPLEWSYRSDFQWLQQEFSKLDEFIEAKQAESQKIFQEQLSKWEQLEDYEKVKVKKPIAPEVGPQFFLGHNVTAIDSLDDQEGHFLTLERPSFRSEEGETLTVKRASMVLCLNGIQKDFKLFEGAQCDWEKAGALHKEPGLYSLVKSEDEDFGLHKVHDSVLEIEKDLGNYFVRE